MHLLQMNVYFPNRTIRNDDNADDDEDEKVKNKCDTSLAKVLAIIFIMRNSNIININNFSVICIA